MLHVFYFQHEGIVQTIELLQSPHKNSEFLCRLRIVEHEQISDSGFGGSTSESEAFLSRPALDESAVRRRKSVRSGCTRDWTPLRKGAAVWKRV